MKKCFKCNKFLPLNKFYKHPKTLDGYLNKCIECVKAYAKLLYKKNKLNGSWIKKERIRNRERYYRLNYKTKHKRNSIANNKWRKNNPLAYKAHIIVNNAIRDGKLTKPSSCENCNKKTKVEAHHKDYSKPLNIRWLCIKCHGITKRI